MSQEDNSVSGTGWSFPVRADHKGDIELSSGETNIKESIRLILGTARGERIMQPGFGCEIHDHVFDSADGMTMTLVEDAVQEALIEWEPRIDLNKVSARRDPDDPGRLLIEIQYTERSTNAEGNMVYPFYVGQ